MPREKKPTLKRRKDGRYRCVYHGLQFYGNTPEEAFAARDEYKLSSQKGFSSRSTVTEYALPWLKRSFPSVADSTYIGLAIHLQHLIEQHHRSAGTNHQVRQRGNYRHLPFLRKPSGLESSPGVCESGPHGQSSSESSSNTKGSSYGQVLRAFMMCSCTATKLRYS